MTLHDRLERSRRTLGAADVLLVSGYNDEAISRAYYAVFYAAEVALLQLGVKRSKHAGVVSAFGQHLVGAGAIDEEYGKIFRDLFDDRNDADYGPGGATEERARKDLDNAGRFIDAIGSWLAEKGPKR